MTACLVTLCNSYPVMDHVFAWAIIGFMGRLAL